VPLEGRIFRHWLSPTLLFYKMKETTHERVIFSPERVLRHMFQNREDLERPLEAKRVSAMDRPLPIFKDYFLANIGADNQNPLLLELRLVDTDHGFSIALLMTNERYPYDLEMISKEMISRLKKANIGFEVVVAPDSLGSRLAQEIARQKGPHFPVTSLQKGKPREENGGFRVGPPKAWIEEESGVAVASGTSHPLAQQKLYLDQATAKIIKENNWRVLWVDDARLTKGTSQSSIELLKGRFGLEIAAMATVLNEAEPTDNIDGIPYIGLTKLPVFDRVEGGYLPREGSFEGLEYFYLPNI